NCPTQTACQSPSSGLSVFRLFPVDPFGAVQFSSKPHPPLTRSTMLLPDGCPARVSTFHSPIQKSKRRRLRSDWHGAAIALPAGGAELCARVLGANSVIAIKAA